MKVLAAVPIFLLLAGCAGDVTEIMRPPRMSSVGSGLSANVRPTAAALFVAQAPAQSQSLWNGSRTDLFSDQRATKIGDVITVLIAINDKATFGNTTDRAQNSEIKGGINFTNQQSTAMTQWNPQSDLTSSSNAQGQGSIDRSENIKLSVAAVVTDVLPNGNLIISGSQEVRVNYELRLLNVAGIIRPIDISRNNTISYDKIAEARISYGGRGRIMEVQQPSYGQQLWDRMKPM
ncbi:flagellar basal body L-ring protein FlgH [Methylovirgula sp. HY1]|uniref:flagellar basal body L-ring protein FlgH n=1 Tax=Methylovirgula sp. HY1 TaxID=2822761 RepID=UPI001C5AB374|nr:flagellar basal body L-ring protein FlgH [Methylovirgula sp. HY1]QXX74712.1 Flagellar L-ring protein [Methylovirgula sp. HY1]